MAYNFNPNFAKHLNMTSINSRKYTVNRNGDETPYSNPSMYDMTQTHYNEAKKSINFANCDEFENNEKMYKLEDFDNPNGWSFSELDMLGEMNFRIDDEYKMYSEVEIPSLKMDNEKAKAFIYKTDEGYVLETTRKYVFESFDKMIKFIDSIPMKKY